jgi:hypothetical protein
VWRKLRDGLLDGEIDARAVSHAVHKPTLYNKKLHGVAALDTPAAAARLDERIDRSQRLQLYTKVCLEGHGVFHVRSIMSSCHEAPADTKCA